MVLGVWLGAAVCVDLLVTRNFSTVDRFIEAPGSPSAAALVKQAGAKTVRFILRRNAAEENAWIFGAWEWTQIILAPALYLMLLLGDRQPPRSALALITAMLVIVLLQRIILTPNVASLGRDMDEIPASQLGNNPIVSRFWAFHGVYSGGEILKLFLGIGLASRLMLRQGTRYQPPERKQADRRTDRGNG